MMRETALLLTVSYQMFSRLSVVELFVDPSSSCTWRSFRMCPVRLAWQDFLYFSPFHQANILWYLELGHECMLPHPFQFIIHSTCVVWGYSLVNLTVSKYKSRILGLHGGDYEECRLLGCVAVWILQEPTFRRNVFLRTVVQSVSKRLTLFSVAYFFSALKMEATRSSETSVFTRCTRRHIPNDGILQV
jgi:hypothetical protein